jgi:hypothetical protein
MEAPPGCSNPAEKLGRVAAHAAEAVELNEHRESGLVAPGGEPELDFVRVAVAASTPNSVIATATRLDLGLFLVSRQLRCAFYCAASLFR